MPSLMQSLTVLLLVVLVILIAAVAPVVSPVMAQARVPPHPDAFAVELGTNLWMDEPEERIPCFGSRDGTCEMTTLDVSKRVDDKAAKIVLAIDHQNMLIAQEAQRKITQDAARRTSEAQAAQDAQAVQEKSAARWKSQAGVDDTQDAQAVQDARDAQGGRDAAATRALAVAGRVAQEASATQSLRDAHAENMRTSELQVYKDRKEKVARDAQDAAELSRVELDAWTARAKEARAAKEARDAAAAAAAAAAEAARQQAARDAEARRQADAARRQAEEWARQQADAAARAARQQYVPPPRPPPPPPPRPPPRPPPKKKCFPADATVVLESGATTRMDALRVGDRVQALAPDGTLAFQPVYLFGHQSASLTSEFVGVLPAGNDRATLWLTPDHYLPVVCMSPASDPACFAAPTLSCARTVPAGWVKPGDIVFVAPVMHGNGNVGCVQKLEPVAVASVTRERKAGLYNPYTTGGWIIVDGAATSSHSDFLLESVTPDTYKPMLPAVYQTLFAPLRALYAVVPSAFVIANAAAQAAHADGWNGLSVTQIVRIGATSIGDAMSVHRQPPKVLSPEYATYRNPSTSFISS